MNRMEKPIAIMSRKVYNIRDMKDMLYGEIPDFETVMSTVRELEKEINTLPLGPGYILPTTRAD